MKKLLLLLIFPFLFACGDDNKEDEPTYIDNSLIAGSWYWIQFADSTVYTYEDDLCTVVVYDRYTFNERQRHNYGFYKLTETEIHYKDMGKAPYYLSNDTLYMVVSGSGNLIWHKKLP